MPFKSEKQRKYLYKNKPEVAKKFAKDTKEGIKTMDNLKHDGRTKAGRKFIERIIARRQARAEAKKPNKAENKEALIAQGKKRYGVDVTDAIREANTLKNVPKQLLKILSASEKKTLIDVLDGKKDFDLSGSVYDKAYNYFLDTGEMPYGVAKARTGDPDQWMIDHMT